MHIICGVRTVRSFRSLCLPLENATHRKINEKYEKCFRLHWLIASNFFFVFDEIRTRWRLCLVAVVAGAVFNVY